MVRLDFNQFVTRLAAALDPSVTVGKATERDYRTRFEKDLPGVWFTAQRVTPLTDGRDALTAPRQRNRIEILVRVVLARWTPGVYDIEDDTVDLVNSTVDALYAWTPTGADVPLSVAGITDGEANESLVTVDILFETEALIYGTP